MHRWIFLLTAFSGWTMGEEGEVASEPSFWKGGTLEIYEENDRVRKSDRNYTQGLRITFTTADRQMPNWVDKIPYIDKENYTANLSLFIGQDIYTPRDITIPTLTVDDQPYAGWLYGGFAVNRRNNRKLVRIEFSFGVVGPASWADEVQTEWHRLIGVELPEGWGHQLKNEPTINITYHRKWKVRELELPQKLVDRAFEGQFLPHVGWALGNVYTHLNVGNTIRFGYNLPDDFGRGTIGQGGPPALGVLERRSNWSVYLFGGVDGRFVIRNIFLDGNTFTNSHSVDKERFAGDLKFGLAVGWKRLSISLTHVIRSREFQTQRSQHEFGSLNIGYKF